MKSYPTERIPILIKFEEKAAFKDTYAGEIGVVTLTAHLIRPVGKPSKTVAVFMHPSASGAYLPLVIALAKAGVHTMWCESRYRGSDVALIMEKVVIDLGNGIKELKTRLGYETIVLGGWSGGGSLSLFFQAEAENPTLTETPAGEPPDLTIQELVPADGIMLIAAHVARHRTFTEWIDPSITDESMPQERDPELNIFNPDNTNQPPYTEEFLARFRAAQITRNRRITSFVRDKLDEYRANGELHREYSFVVHGTMADPRWLDPTIDPNGRKSNWCFLGDPKIVNDSPIGVGRYSSLRSWLSQWSYDDANGDGLASAGRITVPVLVLGNTADDGITPSHTKALYEAVTHDDKELHWIQGANHYYFGQPEKSAEAAALCKDWMQKKGFLN
ncbi:MAG: alpha/beta hydrolase [Gammaproteobacteria bacterium]|nr:alpha/beta hydrolase [Gammaproteobacteria bacterium]